MDETKTVITPEQVAITYTLAGVGTRFGAVLLDTCLEVVVLFAIVWTVAAVVFGLSLDRLSGLEQIVSSWVGAVVIVALFAVLWGYFIFWETIWSGQTPGKRLAGIRVMRDGGYPLDFRAAFVRNIVRYVDFLPVMYGVGAFAMFLSADSKRLGDYAAGTIVVMDSRRARSAPRASAPLPAYPLLGDPSLLNLRALTPEQLGVVDRLLARGRDLPANVRADLARKIAGSLAPVVGIDAPTGDAFPYESWLAELASAYRASVPR